MERGVEEHEGDEVALVLARGDQAAFRVAYLGSVQAVYRFCLARVGPVDAEDALSVVYLEVWRLRHKAVAVDGTLTPWVLAVARNCLRDFLRSRRRHEARLQRYWAHERSFEPVADHAETVAENLYTQAESVRAVGLIAALPEPYDYVARRCLLEDASPATVARELRCPPSTVRGRLAEARVRLARGLRRPSDVEDGAADHGHPVVRRPFGAGKQLRESRA